MRAVCDALAQEPEDEQRGGDVGGGRDALAHCDQEEAEHVVEHGAPRLPHVASWVERVARRRVRVLDARRHLRAPPHNALAAFMHMFMLHVNSSAAVFDSFSTRVMRDCKREQC